MENLRKREKFTSDLRPLWAVEVDKVLAERRITKKQLATDLGLSYSYVINIMTGVTVERTNKVRDAVCAYLGINLDKEAI